MPKIPNADLVSSSPIISGSLDEWGQKLNTITELTEDKINEMLVDLNFVTGVSSIWNAVDVQNYEDLPLIGQPMTMYYVISQNKRYLWGGSVYVNLSLGEGYVTSIQGHEGDVILTKSDIGLSNVDNTSDQTKANTTTYSVLNTTSKTLTGAINEVKASNDLKAPLSSPTFTGTVVLPSTTSIGNVDSTEISYLDGVTSGIQGQLNNKQPLDSDLTAIADLTSNGIIVKTGSGTATTRSIATSGVGISVTNGDGISANPTIVSNATSSNTANAIVSRNADGNFDAGTITATLNGSASTLTTPRTIGAMTGDVTSNGSSFNGSANNSNVATIGANKVTNSKLAQMPTMTIKGNDAVGNADPQDLTVSEVQTMIQDSAHRFVTDAEKITWNSASAGVNTGDIIFRTSNVVPTGYLKANGALVSRTTYSNLFSVIGTTFGAGDGSTTFALPDLRGEFIRGVDEGRGVDSGRTFGSTQGDEIKAHKHRQRIYVAQANGGSYPVGFANVSGGYWTDTWIEETGGTETRPRNIALMAVIKY